MGLLGIIGSTVWVTETTGVLGTMEISGSTLVIGTMEISGPTLVIGTMEISGPTLDSTIGTVCISGLFIETLEVLTWTGSLGNIFGVFRREFKFCNCV